MQWIWVSLFFGWGALSAAITSLEPPMPFLLHLDGTYSFAHIASIQGAVPVKYQTDENKMVLSSWMTTLSSLELGVIFEFNQTKKLPFNLESGGFYLKKNFLDDLAGDLLGLDMGALVQFVPTNRLTDPITPYNAMANFSGFFELYKSFLFHYDEICLTPFLDLDVGMANRGYPWIDPGIGGRFQYLDFSFEASLAAFFGLGPEKVVNVDDFRGYAKIGYQAMDLELTGSYQLLDEGSLRVGYFGRLFAWAYPQGRQGFFVEVDLPLPLF